METKTMNDIEKLQKRIADKNAAREKVKKRIAKYRNDEEKLSQDIKTLSDELNVKQCNDLLNGVGISLDEIDVSKLKELIINNKNMVMSSDSNFSTTLEDDTLNSSPSFTDNNLDDSKSVFDNGLK